MELMEFLGLRVFICRFIGRDLGEVGGEVLMGEVFFFMFLDLLLLLKEKYCLNNMN